MKSATPFFSSPVIFPALLPSGGTRTAANKHFGIPFIDVTPDLRGDPRCHEILAWLERYPEVSRFSVIDDEDDELDELPLFQPSSSTGQLEQV